MSNQRNSSRTASKSALAISRTNQWRKTSVPETVKFEEALHENFLIGVTVTAKFTSVLFKLEGLLWNQKTKIIAMTDIILFTATLFISRKYVALAVAVTAAAATSSSRSSSRRFRRRSSSRHCRRHQSGSGRHNCCF